jgi:Rho family protein
VKLTTQWIEEVRQICGKAIPVILVACKADLRDKAIANGTFTPERYIDTVTVSRHLLHCRTIKAITDAQGQRVAQSIGARGYYETSSLLNQGVDSVFEAATRAAVLVRDQGHGGVGNAYDKDGNRESYRGTRRADDEVSGKCANCLVM